MKINLLEKLNESQKEAVKYENGPLLIIAGAGTGKTTVLTHRIAYLISQKLALPSEILALTFTDRASLEMEERVDILTPYGYNDVWISTFHSFGDRVLRQHALELGLDFNFKVLNKIEQIIFLKEHLFELPLEIYRPLGNPSSALKIIVDFMSRLKDEDITPAEFLNYSGELLKNSKSETSLDLALRYKELANMYDFYQKLTAKYGFLDFGDQVNLTLKLFRTFPSILKKYQKQFKFILIDEFQDTNFAQYQLVKLLSWDHQNITVVGDDDQSIYKFRGAAISNILNFTLDFSNVYKVVLNLNYRSGQNILEGAYRLILHNNPERLEVKQNIDKSLKSLKKDKGAVNYYSFDYHSSEAEFTANTILDKISSGYSYKDIAVLFRSNKEADLFLRIFNFKGIPFRFSGSAGLYYRSEIRLLISILKVLTNPNDSLNLYYLITSEIYQLQEREAILCMSEASKTKHSLYYIFKNINKFFLELFENTLNIINRFLKDLEEYQKKIKDLTPGKLLYLIITEKNILTNLTKEESYLNDEKIGNIAKFFEIIQKFEELFPHSLIFQFIEHLDLLIASGDDPYTISSELNEEAVNVLTVHKSKGLEFPIVFMPGLVAGRFPSQNRKDFFEIPIELIKYPLPSGDFHIQEERRLFYVGMTRAKDELILTSSKDYGGKRIRKVSPFVLEGLDLPKASLNILKTSKEEFLKNFGGTKIKNLNPSYTFSKDKMLVLSYLKIDDYLTCPLKYKFVHILKIPILKHHSVVYGRAIHEAISSYLRSKIEGEKINLEKTKEIFKKFWTSVGFITRIHEEKRYQEGLRVLEEFYFKEELQNTIPAYVEKKFNFLLENNKIVGRWDCVRKYNGEESIIDFKASNIKSELEAAKKAKESLQLSIYALAYKYLFGKLPDFVELYFLESGITGRVKKTKDDIEKAKSKIKEAALGIREGEFSPSANFIACQYCAYQEICSSKYGN